MPTSTKTNAGRGPGCGVFAAAGLAVAIVGGITLALGGKPAVLVERCAAIADGETHTLTPEQTQNAALITRVAIRRGLPARAATIALATAVQESDLRNIDYGDRDSVGLFQQRPSQGWGTVEQIMDPVYSTGKFYDGLVKVDGYETMVITEAAQKVQRSGFPRAYADHEPEGRAFASSLTGYSRHALACSLRPAGSIDDMQAHLEQVAGALTERWDAEVEVDAETGTVTILAGEDSLRGWALAHHVMAYAKAWDADSIAHDGYRWDRDDNSREWTSSEDAPAQQIVVTFTP